MAQTRSRTWLAVGTAAAMTLLIIVASTGGGPSESAERSSISVPDPLSVYDPVSAGEAIPDGYRPALGRDDIEPVYTPVFTEGSAVEWPGDMLVIGVAGDSTAKAYPVTHLNSREMVIDSLDGIPILVSW